MQLRRGCRLWWVALPAILIDRVCKAAIMRAMMPGQVQTVLPGLLSWAYTRNRGVAFGLLSVVGINMIKEALEEGESQADPDLSVKAMLPLAVATSIDALAVGVSLAMAAEVSIWTAVLLIGVTTFCLSAVGAAVGGVFGRKYEKKAEIFGGVTLICLGLKILLENLGVL